MKTLTQLKKERGALEEALVGNTLAINSKLAKTVVTCESNAAYGDGCGGKFFIKKLSYIQTHWYETSSGCMGGAMWHRGEGQFECPLCQHRNRLYTKPSIEALKGLFGNMLNEYKD